MGRRDYQSNKAPLNISKPSKPELTTIIQGSPVESAEKTVIWAEKLGSELAKANLTTAQIRGIFGQVRQIEMSWSETETDARYAEAAKRSLLLLIPKIVYQAGRESQQNRHAVEELAGVIIPAIELVQGDRGNFQRFVDFFEAILAYHKAEGGK